MTAGTSAKAKAPSRAPAERIPSARASSAKMKASAASASITPKAPMMREPNDSEAGTEEGAACNRDAGIVFEDSHETEEKNRHRDRKGRVFRVHEHVAVVERTGGEQDERGQSRRRPADAAPDAPGEE